MRLTTTLSLLLAIAVNGYSQSIVINEIDYDQIGTDNAEFIELKNTGTGTVTLGGYYLLLVSGGGATPSVYDSIALPNVALTPNAYFVICGDSTNVNNCDYQASKQTNLIQNGGTGTSGPDAVALYHPSKTRMDVISYEGSLAGYVEVSGNSLKDNPNNPNSGLSRFPDGTDTNNNDQDVTDKCISPGAANLSTDTNCVVVTSSKSLTSAKPTISIQPNPSEGLINITSKGGVPSEIEVLDWTGKTVLRSSFVSVLDLRNYASGMYFIRSKFEDQVLVEKVILR